MRKITETRGSSGGIFAVSRGSLRCTTAENRGLNRISVKDEQHDQTKPNKESGRCCMLFFKDIQ